MFFPLRDYRPSGIIPYVTYALLAVNIAAFIYQFLLGNEFSNIRFGRFLLSENDILIRSFGMVPCKLFGQCVPHPLLIESPVSAWITVFSSMFLHGDILHLGSNMLFLWIFGDNVEAAFGRGRFLLFYFICGIAAALSQAFLDTSSIIPLIGASGAISGVLGAYVFMFPRSGVLTMMWLLFFIRFIILPAWVILGIWFLIQLFSAVSASNLAQGGVAFMAHLGGFITGALLYRLFKKEKSEPPRSPWQSINID